MEYYSKKIIDRFLHPKNLGKIKDADGIGDTTNLRCGDLMKIYLKIEKKLDDGSYSHVFTSKVMNVKSGVIQNRFVI